MLLANISNISIFLYQTNILLGTIRYYYANIRKSILGLVFPLAGDSFIKGKDLPSYTHFGGTLDGKKD